MTADHDGPDEDAGPGDDADDPFGGEPVALEIDGVLDLHTFSPRDVPDLVPTYLDECRARGILEVRIIHGKGTGTLRRTVHAILDRRDDVVRYALAPGHRAGGAPPSWSSGLSSEASRPGARLPVVSKPCAV